MNLIFSVLAIAAPLLLITMGALISEYAGRLAMFLECLINLGAFVCYAFTVKTGSTALGVLASTTICTATVIALERVSSKFRANMFLISLAMNLLFSSFTTFFSAIFFGTRGVLYSEIFSFAVKPVMISTSVICYAVCLAEIIMLRFTNFGLALRITGSDSDVLESRGLSSDRFKLYSWIFAAVSGALCGCTLALRVSSYVPGMSGGRGWTALAAVFLGRKHPVIVVLAVLVFAVAEYASSHIQNIAFFENVPSSVLLSLPYLISLFLIIVIPQKKETASR